MKNVSLDPPRTRFPVGERCQDQPLQLFCLHHATVAELADAQDLGIVRPFPAPQHQTTPTAFIGSSYPPLDALLAASDWPGFARVDPTFVDNSWTGPQGTR